MNSMLYTHGTGAFDAFSTLIVVLIIGGLIYAIAKNVSQWKQNNNSPNVTVNATVVAKRTEVWGHEHAHTNYYVTFQLENGERLELPVKGTEYGMLSESDHGKLSHHGTRYHGFERD